MADADLGTGARLKAYWTRGKGLAKWAGSPHPWTALNRQLTKYIPDPDKRKRTVSAWHFAVFHQHTGSDAYRLEHGGHIRGQRIGPG